MGLTSAYQGRGWRPRRGDAPGTWATWRADSEYKKLEAVLLYVPGRELSGLRDPNRVQHLSRIDVAALRRECGRLASALRKRGVAVYRIARDFSGPFGPPRHNLLFVRDLFFASPAGVVVSRMASAARAGEEKHAARALAGLGVPIIKTISGRGTFEGADALWLDRRTVIVGVGNRTNAEGLRQLRGVLKDQGVETLVVALPRGVQHLLGILQVVDRRLAFLRTGVASGKIAALLARRGFRVVPVPESEETTRKQGMNLVAVAPRTILMPRGCPGLKRLYLKAGVRVAAELDIGQFIRGAGGLACAVGVLSRRI